jgi:hypothetical protein
MTIKTAGIANNGRIHLFDRFVVDTKLPKHDGTPRASDRKTALLNANDFQTLSHESRWMILDAIEEADNNSPAVFTSSSDFELASFPIRRKSAGDFFSRLYRSSISKIEDLKSEDVRGVFARVKMSTREIGEWLDRNDELKNATEAAVLNGQSALAKSLKAEYEIRCLENALFVKGHKKYLTEADLLEFTNKCEKGLAIDWISDFTRPIPASVTAKIKEMNELCIFDNYSILHFDPGNKAVSPKAVEKRKDPIVFGMIKNSRALYFVDDWEDEYCNLRFDQIVKSLGRDLELK